MVEDTYGLTVLLIAERIVAAQKEIDSLTGEIGHAQDAISRLNKKAADAIS